MDSDVQLVADALAGGPSAFGPIVQRYQDAVFGVALARLGDFHAAQDVAQDVFVKAFGSLGALRNPARLGGWLRTMAIHKCVDHLRQRRPTADVTESRAAASPDGDPAERLQRRELREAVLEAIGRLSKVQRETVALYYVNGYCVADVAGMLGVPEGTVKGRLYDARANLKREMIAMVEDVLKSEAPREDFTARVLELLGNPDTPIEWSVLAGELREIGEKGADGFEKAMASPSPRIRNFATTLIRKSALGGERLIGLLTNALSDSNKHVRRHAARALLVMPDVPEQRKRTAFVPLILPLLRDPSTTVRHKTAMALASFAGSVPLAQAAAALATERHPRCRRAQEFLIRNILAAGGPT